MAEPEKIDNAQTLLNAGAASALFKPVRGDDQSIPTVVVPAGYQLQTLDFDKAEKWLNRPRRKRGKFVFADVKSFAAYFKEHKEEGSRVFVHYNTGKVEGVLNFHGDDGADWLDHCAFLDMPYSKDWTALMEKNKEAMTQLEFAEFLEEFEHLFVSPHGADLLEMITNLEAKANVQFRSGVKLQSGQIKLMYDETIDMKGGSTGVQTGVIEMPRILVMSVKLFQTEEPVTLEAFLKFKIENRAITFSIQLRHLEKVIQELYDKLQDEIDEACETKSFLVPPNAFVNRAV
jgi:uncharacterized protein YfdQ (DUF2303 family)